MNEFHDQRLSFRISTLLTVILIVVCLLLAYSSAQPTLPPLLVWLLVAVAVGFEFAKCRAIYFVTAMALLFGWLPLLLLTAIVGFVSR